MKNLLSILLGIMLLAGMGYGQSITITSPNGGENLDGCTTHTIAWTATGTSNSFSIDYSIDNGANWTSVASFYFTTVGTFSWQVPNVSSTNCLVRVYDSNAAAVTDESDAVFSINGPLILQTPNGGENWVAGTVQNISWFASGTSNVYKLEYSTNNGANWIVIANNLNNTTGSYNWTVPNVNTSQAQVRITDINNAPCMSDKSDLVFNIISTIQVTTPNGGESFTAMVGPNGGSFNMDATDVVGNTGNFYDNGGRTGNYSAYQNVVKTFYPDNPNRKLQFTFTDFSTANGSDYLRIYDGPTTSSPLLGTFSGSTSPTTVTSTHKTGALTFFFVSDASSSSSGWKSYYTTVGAGTQPLNWNITGTSGVYNLEFSSNGGASWSTIISEYPSATGTFDWPVPNVVTTSARLRVVDFANSTILDASNANFSIGAASPSMLLCTPNGGESPYAGTNLNITWRTGFTTNANVMLEVSTDNGSSWSTIVASTLNDGSYVWAVPNTPSTTCLVRMSEVGNPTAFDVSDAVFTIQPHYRITVPNGGESLLGCNTPYSITWYQGGTSNFVDIDLSTNGGSSWISIANNLSKSGTLVSHNWTINNLSSSNCLMRVRDHNDTAKVDLSDAPFTINATSNTVVNQPNGGEFWVAGGTFPIVYVVGGTVTNVRLEYSTNGGTTWSTIVTSTSGGVYNWTIPNINTNQALIRATDVSNSCNTDVSNAVFNIVSEVSLTLPNGGETFQASGGPNGGIYLMNSTADVTMTTGNLYDSGGPSGNYASSQNITRTIYPFNPNSKLRITFSDFNTANGSDYLRIYDGPSTSSPLLGTFSGTNNPGTITSSHKLGALTFTFVSDASTASSGFKGYITSYLPTNPDITWNVTGTSHNFDLDYSTDGGVTWIQIADDVAAASAGTFSWAVPNTVTSNGRVRVMDASNTSILDQSDNAFNITAATPVYLQCYPNGGEVLYAGNTANLQWATAFSTSPYVRIELSTDNGSSWTTIIASTFNDGTEPWPITNTPSNTCLMRVTDTANPLYTDVSDATFTIRPYVTVLAPNGGQTLTGCTSYNIQWENGGTSNLFDLDYSLDGGTTWTNIVSNLSRTTTIASYTWSVPNLSSPNGRIRVTDSNSPLKTDLSDANFLFQPSQNVQVINPNGGQNMVAGTIYPILYAVQGGVTTVRIEYSQDSGATWATVINSTSGGTYNWTVPNVSTTKALVRISSTSNACNYDESDAVFNIISEITVSSPNGGEVIVASGGINGGTFPHNVTTDAVLTTGDFYDYGGSGSYPANLNTTRTYYPYNPHAKLQVAFHAFQTEATYDYLRIYDGPGTSSPLIGTYSGSSSPGIVTSTHKTGALTFQFVSNSSTQYPGWQATMTSIHPQNHLVSWANTGTSGAYDLEVSTNNGTSWTRIVSDYTSVSNTFSWPAPNTPTTQALFRVKDASNGSILDQSNATFTIGAGTPAYLVCYPNGGETVSAGDVRTLTWRSGLTVNPNVRIELTTDDGSSWSNITAATFDGGSYAWTVPNVPSSDCRIRVSDATNPAYTDQSDTTFTIKPYITVLSPNGGNALTGCTSHNITWENGGTSDYFDLSYSLDGGATWIAIASNLYRPQSVPTYPWPVPNVISSQCLVAVTDRNDPLKTDTSNAVFSINPTLNVQVVQPNGGENLISNIIYPINYTVQGGVNNVRLEYSIDSGATWATIITSTNGGSYNWTVPNLPTTKGLIRITDVVNSCNFDVSDAVFSILSDITVLNPNGGQTIVASGGTNGGAYTMSATDVVITTGNFYDNGGVNGSYPSNTNLNQTFYPYNPNAKLRVTFHEFSTYDSGDYLRVYNGPTTSSPLMGTFSGSTIPNALTSTHKTGALTFVFVSNTSGQSSGWKASMTNIHADNYVISWANTGTSGEYDLEVSTNNGSVWTRIVSEYTSTTNSFIWPAPNVSTTNALVRVKDHNNGNVLDVSNATFNINTTTPAYLVCYPNGGEIVYAGRTVNVTWRSGFTTNPYVRLEYSIDNGSTWITIASNVFDSGTYAWTVPNTPTTTALFRVSDNANAAFFDESDATFTIRPYITVLYPNGGENVTGCTNTTITWENGGTSNYFDLYYSTDAGSTWNTIASNLYKTQLNATHVWAAPNVISSQCLIRIEDSNDPLRADTSNALFNINPSANVQVLSPNGGETWVSGAIYPINYALQGGVTNVRIEYSTNGGTTWGTIISSTNGGSYSWTVPNFASTNTLIRITDTSNPCNFDISNAVFTVLSEIDLVAPNGGDTVRASVVSNGATFLLNTSADAFVGVANFYDSGGLSNYGTSSNITRTFYPENPDHKLRVYWGDFSTYNSADYLRVYDGETTSGSALIGTYSGSTLPPTITSTHKTGALTFQFVSDPYSVSSGWSAYLVGVGVNNVPVSWSTIGTSGVFNLDYSTNNGASWIDVIDNYESPSGTFSWPVPNTPSNTARFRVVDYNNGSILDGSDTTFVIQPGIPRVVVCQPNGGESYSAGNNATIRWGSIFLSAGSVRLEYSTNNGSSWGLINNAVVNNGSYTWSVPNTPSANCLVRVTDFGNAANTDASDSVFTIRPHITVVNPNGGETVTGCNGYPISWLHGGTSGSFKLELSTNSGSSWSNIATVSAGGSTGSYSWVAPNVNASNCRIRISDANDPTKRDSSDADFSLQKTFDVTVNSPNGSENWVAGTQQNIIYTLLNGVSNVRLEYSTNNGTSWFTIVSNTSGGSYTWTIPNIPTSQALVRATDVSNNCKSDASDAVFNIVSSVQVATPNGGEIWQGQVGTPGGIFNMSNTPVVCNSGNFFDDGGESGGYGNSVNYTKTFRPDISTNKIQVTFTSFSLASSDILRVYDGPTTGFPVIGTYSSSNIPTTVTSTHSTGALTFNFSTSTSGNSTGWESYVSTVGTPTQNITWSATGTSGGYNIDYSTNGGLTWVNIVEEFPGVNGGIYPWQVPNTPSSNCLVRVSDDANGNIVDVSDATFTIGAANPHMYSPNGGESVYSGVAYDILWDAPTYLSTNVQLEYSTNGGLSWILIEAFTFNDGTYSWTPPQTAVALPNCYIRVSESGNTIAYDVSDQPFTINPAIRITSPNSNAGNWRGCTVSTISWVAGASSNYRIELSVDSGATWSTVAANYINGNSVVNYPWNIPNTPSTNCLVRVTDNNNPTRTDVSDSVFTITPTLTITQPNYTGQQIQGGSNFTIAWNSNVVSNFYDIDYTTNNGSTWNNIITNYFTTTGNYVWAVPATVAPSVKVRVRDNLNTCKEDISDYPFSITAAAPAITVSTPNGGETLTGCSTYAITWSELVTSGFFNIDASFDGGASWSAVASNYNTGSGSYLWTVPNVNSAQCLVRVTDAADPNKVDVSNQTFTIGQSLTAVITASGPTSICAGDTLYLTSSSATNNTWAPFGQTTQTIAVTSTGNYNVTVAQGGCQATSQNVAVTVNAAPTTPTITASGSTTLCSGDNVVLTSSSPSGNTWSNSATTQAISVTTAGTYYVTTANQFGCTAVSSPITVTVNPLPATPSASSNSPLITGSTITLFSSTVPGATYNWSGPSGFNSTQQNPTIPNATTNMSGTYSVTATVNGCTSMAGTVNVSVVLPGGIATISGAVRSELGDSVRTVTVSKSGFGGPSSQVTGLNGFFQYNLTANQNYTLTPSKVNDTTTNNGITTLDIILMRRHILNDDTLGSPYKILAADVNFSNTVTTLDIVLTRRVVLQTTLTFPSGRLWTFVNSDFVFANPISPWPYESFRTYPSAATAAGQDFVGVKLGDVNNSWSPSVAKQGYVGELGMDMENVTAKVGEIITIPVRVRDFQDVSGYQFTMQWDPSNLEYMGVENGVLSGEFGEEQVSNGKLSTSWDDETGGAVSLEDGAKVFSLQFLVKGQLGAETMVYISSVMAAAEGYTKDLDLLALNTRPAKVSFGGAEAQAGESGFALGNNVPNPFETETEIAFKVPETSQVQFSIFGLDGRMVKTMSGAYEAGTHKIKWDGRTQEGDQVTSGVYYIRMTSGDFTATRKMVYMHQ